MKRTLEKSIWAQREYIGGRWGFCFEVYWTDNENEQEIAFGWRLTREQAELAAAPIIQHHGKDQ